MNPAEFKALRKGTGLTQARLAEELDLSREFVGSMERGLVPIGRRTALAVRYLTGKR